MNIKSKKIFAIGILNMHGIIMRNNQIDIWINLVLNAIAQYIINTIMLFIILNDAPKIMLQPMFMSD